MPNSSPSKGVVDRFHDHLRCGRADLATVTPQVRFCLVREGIGEAEIKKICSVPEVVLPLRPAGKTRQYDAPADFVETANTIGLTPNDQGKESA